MTDETPVPPAPSRWTPEVVIGLLCLIASAVLPHLDFVGIGSALALVAAWLLGPVPSFLTPRQGPPRGYARADVLAVGLAIGLALFAVALLASSGGCAATRSGERLDIVLQDHPTAPAPACHYRVSLDGELVVEGDVDFCPSVPVCSEVEP